MGIVRARGRAGLPAALLGLIVVTAGRAEAGQVLFGTSLEGQKIVRIETGTNTVTTVANLPVQADSFVFAPNGDIIYTGISNGTVHDLNPTTLVDTTIASGLSGPRDIALEPGGTSVLVSDFNHHQIERVSLLAGHATSILTSAFFPDGLTYVNGRLFAVSNRDAVVELDPITGAIMNSSGFLSGDLDGLGYDSFTSQLFVSRFGAGNAFALNPNTLAVNGVVGSGIPNPDGITSNGTGSLFVAARGDFHVYEINLLTNTTTQETFVDGLDDLAPASGLGAAAPEPSTLLSGSLAGLLGLGYAWRKRRAKSAA